MQIRFQPLDSETVRALRAGWPDAHGQPAERVRAEGGGNPCRHCLDFVPDGAEMLVCAHRPFPAPQPYAETGPIFLCAAACAPWAGQGVPPILRSGPDYLLKGYDARHRIVYGTGGVVAAAKVAARAEDLLARPEIAFVDVRSARNNCFQARIRRDV
ncbi:MAG: DUF1203 domain-containing protein [Rhodobacteraceae bacterium]|uniref:DUF1203 domain-containing protein n=1 Tax=Albidovulum sp. TaxID=1872424 RepID=UPI001DA2D48D|nr:DUF1203 domain-containing protein [Paracoccaceae bacterium]MCB2143232.1 DUF1203 domain-containing protein [Paracoccaceae bacterium]MCB2158788.1 DUF1203 domain-containing protein [Paracoccaceae bacterium]MCP5356116.1 DUF1203 domain-containing protein [Paracoccaceae bacterium]HPE25863.1 DUF1203 domain-containing protein [Albidovulum sp.]